MARHKPGQVMWGKLLKEQLPLCALPFGSAQRITLKQSGVTTTPPHQIIFLSTFVVAFIPLDKNSEQGQCARDNHQHQ